MIGWIFFFFTFALCIFEGFIIFRLSSRLFQFDNLFNLFQDDIEINAKYLKKLLSTPLLENSPEIIEANRNMKIISQRLEEFSRQMSEATNRTE